MDIQNIKVGDLVPYVRNQKKHDKKQINNVAESIKQFGMVQPIVVDKDNNIIIGHCRLLACKKLKIKEVPVVKLEDLSPEEANKLRLLDNKLNESDWDFELLAEDIPELDWEGFDIDWNLPDLETEEEIKIVEDEVPENVENVAKLGDLFEIGNHRLICGDSTDVNVINKLMNGAKADLLFTDPPYGVSYENKTKEVLKTNNYTKIANDDLKGDDFKSFLKSVFDNAYKNIKETASYYVFSCQGGDQEMMMMMMMRECGIPCRHQIIWVKDAPVFSMGRLDYDYKHEPILYGWVKKHNFIGKGEQTKSVWEYKRTANKLHPTMKPVELICNALKNSTKEKDLVLDLFGGSGSTLIACEQLNRKCYMCELDPHYCDVIINRYMNLTGKDDVYLIKEDSSKIKYTDIQ